MRWSARWWWWRHRLTRWLIVRSPEAPRYEVLALRWLVAGLTLLLLLETVLLILAPSFPHGPR